jgi:4-carboxymuconolactone decarboxylase
MRIEHFRPESLTPAQRALYDAIAGGPRRGAAARVVDDDGRLLGPFNAMLTQPVLGSALQEVGRTLRFEGVLTERARELVILRVAYAARSDYEWEAHARLAIDAGLSEAEVHALAEGEHGGFAADERTALELAGELLNDIDISEEQFARAAGALGDDGVFEVTVLVGYYRLLAQQLSIFRVPAPPGPWAS